MPQVLVRTEYTATITWLGQVPDTPGHGLASQPVEALSLNFAGPRGEAHAGLTRASCSRVTDLYKRGTEIRNVRQLSILSAEELAEVAARMELEAIDPAWLGASMVVRGIPDFTHVPPGARLHLPGRATLTVDMENLPCVLPGKVIEGERPGFGARFKRAAADRRGVTAWVEREGRLELGDRLELFVPAQRAWAPGG